MVSPLLVALLMAASPSPVSGLRVPAGFEVTEFADSSLANDIYTLTLNAKGQVFVASRGYLRTLIDQDSDGKADVATEFAGEPKDGAMGLLWEGDTLYCTGDGGLLRFRDTNGDGVADGRPERLLKLKTGGEHAAHALRRGPDGWLHVLCGNNTGIDASYATSAQSPIRKPVAGCVLRLSPDLKTCEIVADGLRNAYDMDFNLDGELFTYDSDNERCVSLPWYEYCRFYHVLPGGHHGWLNPQHAQWWRLPPYLVDVAAPVTTLGRGSPTGCVCYRHTQFPERYRGGFFLCDWTFGKIYFVALERRGASYVGKKEVFLESTGDNGFAPTAAVVDPRTGDLYVSIGGRGTRGAVYRIRYPTGQKEAQSLFFRTALPETDLLTQVRRLETLRRTHGEAGQEKLLSELRASLGQSDRSVRQAAARLLAVVDETTARMSRESLRTGLEKTTFALGRDRSPETVRLIVPLIDASSESIETPLAAVRVVQRWLGDVASPTRQGMIWEGYSTRGKPDDQLRREISPALRRAFPSGDAALDRELSRTLGMLEDEDSALPIKLCEKWTATSDPLDDIHYLIVLSRLTSQRSREITNASAFALLALDQQIVRASLTRDRHWPLRMTELHRELARKDEQLNAAMLTHKDFGRPDHAVWTLAPGLDRRTAARRFLERASFDKEYAWNAEVLRLLGELPPEQVLSTLRQLWGEVGLDEALLPLLARQPNLEDRDKFLSALRWPQSSSVGIALTALQKLPPSNDATTLLALIQALRRLPEVKEEAALRQRLVQYLQQLTKEKLGDSQAWTQWLATKHPQLAERVRERSSVDLAAWKQRLARISWTKGVATRGQRVYQKASCAACHSGSQALGPDLQGVAGRFSREDLFTAIVDPNRDVPARYRTTLVTTSEDRTFQGMIIYEAVDSVILQTGAASTIRLANRQIRDKSVSLMSLMPTGLLDSLTDGELADLYAYLRSLGVAKTKP